MDRFVSIGETAQALGVSRTTVRRWEREGKLVPEHTPGGHRRDDVAQRYPERFRGGADVEKNRGVCPRIEA
jgi:excisionase family DNA binding protein